MVSVSLAAAFTVALAAPKPRVAALAEAAVVRTANDVYLVRRLSFADGAYRFHDGAGERVLKEDDVLHAVFMPSLESLRGPGRGPERRIDPIVFLGLCVAIPGKMFQAKDIDRMIAAGGIFLRPDDDPAKLVPPFAKGIRSPLGHGLLSYETIQFYRAQNKPRDALAVLEKTEGAVEDSRAALAFGILRAALLYNLGDPEVRNVMHRLFLQHGTAPEFLRFRAFLMPKDGSRPRPRPDGPGRKRGGPPER